MKILMAVIFLKKHLYTAYADYTAFFHKDEKSALKLMKAFDVFSTFSRLKPNKSKCKTADLGAMKEVKLALCGVECIDLMFNTIKILEDHYSYDVN